MCLSTVAEGVHRISEAYVNFYLIEGSDGITLVDSGLPGMWKALHDAFSALGRSVDDVRAVVLTHAHFDHLGTAHALQSKYGIPVWVHPEDEYIARHPYRYNHEKSPFLFSLAHPAGLPVLARMARAGALRVHGVEDLTFFPASGSSIAVPGIPEIVYTPGHTAGHCGLLLRERGILFSGDALVTLDPYTGRTGPRMVAGAATADIARNRESLSHFADTSATLVLPGHGEPWAGDVAEAVARARSNRAA